jgi:hypothetical protein
VISCHVRCLKIYHVVLQVKSYNIFSCSKQLVAWFAQIQQSEAGLTVNLLRSSPLNVAIKRRLARYQSKIHVLHGE